MTPDEVLAEVKKSTGVELTRMTLTTYENAGLVSKPERGGGGRGVGRWTNYAECAVPEVIAAFTLVNGKYCDLTAENPPRLAPGIVLAAKVKAVSEYKHRDAAPSRYDKSKHAGMELLLLWLEAVDEIPDECFGEKHKNLTMAEAWIKIVSGYAIVWEYEYRKAWDNWKNSSI